jgi:hypothetical protein
LPYLLRVAFRARISSVLFQTSLTNLFLQNRKHDSRVRRLRWLSVNRVSWKYWIYPRSRSCGSHCKKS